MTPSIAQDALGAGLTDSAPLNPFQKLISELSRILGPSSGLDSSDVDVQELQTLMENYISLEDDWDKYAFQDLSRGYTRNLIDEGNGKSNLLILVWTPGKGSPVHDHADAHCLMKVLKGTLKETRFDLPKNNATPPQVIKETLYHQGQVTYMADELGLHKISNPDKEEVAVSLHLYTPPNAAKEGCNIFNEQTGKRSHITQSNFFSRFGKKVDESDRENYKRAFMSWEESRDFITRYAAKQQDQKLLSVNDAEYHCIIATWRLDQQTEVISAGGAIPGDGGDGKGEDVHATVEQKLKEKKKRPVLRRFGTFRKGV